MSGETRKADEHHGWWPGWVWALPLAALGLVAWLALRAFSQSGPQVTVIFPQIANLKPGDTKVEFEGMDVGQVQDVTLEPDLTRVKATLSLDPVLHDHLGKGTRFWVIGASPSLSDPSAIKALITGVSVGILPHSGPARSTFEAQSTAPELAYAAKGTQYTLRAPKLGSLQRGTPIYFLDREVGKVVGTRLTPARDFDIDFFIDSPFDKLVHDGSRFWNAGPIRLSTGGSGPSLQFQSLPALFEGAIAFETPDGASEGPLAKAGRIFKLYDGEDAARYAPGKEGVAYRVVFRKASGVPTVNAAVTLMGKRIGSVAAGQLLYDPLDASLSVAATIVLEPGDITLTGATWTDPRAQMDDMMRHLVAAGLRAELSSSPPVIGGEQVSLALVPGKSGSLGSGPVPEIPTEEGGGVAGIMSSANDIMAKADEVPIGQIAGNMDDISRHIARLTSSPALEGTLRAVDRSTNNLERITGDVRRDLPPTLAELRRTVANAQASLASAQDLLSAQGNAASAPESADLPQTLYEISSTARSLRELTGFLDRHPSALLTGRGASQ